MEERREYKDFVFSPPHPSCPWLRFQLSPLWSSHCLETLPSGPAVYPGEESTHSEQCPPKLASRRAWKTGMFLSPCSIAQGSVPSGDPPSFIVCHSWRTLLQATCRHTHTHTHTLLPLNAFCSSSTSTFYISHNIFCYIYIPRRRYSFFT